MGSNWPNFNGLIASQWPNGIEGIGGSFFLSGASNIVFGTNPQYGPADYFALYPQFGGSPIGGTGVMGTLTGAVLTGITQTVGLGVGWPVSGPGIPPNTSIASIDSSTQLTLTNAGLQGGANFTIQVFNPASYVVPAAVIGAFLALASSSLSQARWGSAWIIAMGWYVSHFLVLWLRANGDPCTQPGRIAANALTRGITVAKSVGPVSQSIQPVTGLEDWAAWTSTEPGTAFCTMAKVVGMGASLCW